MALLTAALLILPVACSEVDCTSNTVRIVATVPAEVAAGVVAIDLQFEVDGASIHTQRLDVVAGSTTAKADIVIPGGYPTEKRVVVTAVAKRASGEVVATWYASEVFPFGCTGFVFTLFPSMITDAGVLEGGTLFPDGSISQDARLGDAAPDTRSIDALVIPDSGTSADALKLDALIPADAQADDASIDAAGP